MIGLGEPVLFSWIVSAALQSSTIAFDISIHSKDDSSTVFRNNMSAGTLCNSSGNCEWNLSSELPIEQGKNYESHISVSSGDVRSPKSVADFGVLRAEPIEEVIASNQEVTISEPDSRSTDPNDTVTGDAYEKAKVDLDLALSLEPSWYTTLNMNTVNGGQVTTEAYYHRAPAFHGLVMAYEVTGDISYLQKGVDLAMDYVNAGRDMDGDGYWDWIWGHRSDPDRINVDHYEWRSAVGVAVVAAALHDSGASVSPSNALSKMTSMLETHMWDKWQPGNQPAGKSNVATRGSGGAARNARIAIALHKITGDEKYNAYLMGRPLELINSMKASYKSATNSYNITWWTNGTGGPSKPAPYESYDVSHANDVITMFDYARTHGYDFGGNIDATFHQRLVDTLKNVVWTDRYLTMHVDGGGINQYSPNAPVEYVTRQVAGWAPLTTYDNELFQKALNYANTDVSITDPRGPVTYENRLLLFAVLMRGAAAND